MLVSPSASSRPSWTVSLAAALLLASPALGLGAEDVDASEMDAPARSYEHHIAQGRFLLDSGRSRSALSEFEEAAAMEAGERDVPLQILIITTCFDLGELGCAVERAKNAYARPGGRDDEELAGLHSYLVGSFGRVLTIGAHGEGARRPEPATVILDPELKRVFEAQMAALDRRPNGPSTTLYLPVGTYYVGEHLVSVESSRTVKMDLRAGVGEARKGVYGEKQAADPGQGSRHGKRRQEGAR